MRNEASEQTGRTLEINSWEEIRKWIEAHGIEEIDIAELWRQLPDYVRFNFLDHVILDLYEAGHKSDPIEELERLAADIAETCFDRERVKHELAAEIAKGPDLVFRTLTEPDYSFLGGKLLAGGVNALKFNREVKEYVYDTAMPKVAEIAVRHVKRTNTGRRGILSVISAARGVSNRFVDEFRDQLIGALTRLALEVLKEIAPEEVFELIEIATDAIRDGFRAHTEYTYPPEYTLRAWTSAFVVSLNKELQKANGLVSGIWYVIQELELDFPSDDLVIPEVGRALARMFDSKGGRNDVELEGEDTEGRSAS